MLFRSEKVIGTPEYIEAAREHQDYVDSLTAWAENRRNVLDRKLFGDDFAKHNVIHIETDHWMFATNLVGRRIDIKCLSYPLPKWFAHEFNLEKATPRQLERVKLTLNPDQSARVYAERLEFLYRTYLEKFEAHLQVPVEDEAGDLLGEDDEEEEETDPANPGKVEPEWDYEITKGPVGGGRLGYYIWRTVPEQKAASFLLTNSTQENGITLESTYTLHCTHDKDGGEDRSLLHSVVHTGSMVILSSYVKFERDAIPCWFSEALGHWMEYYLLGEARVCTRRELTFDIVIPNRGLRGRVYKMVKEKKYDSLAGYCGRDFDNLTVNQRVQSFSIFDYMVQDSQKLRDWTLHVKNNKDQAKAFRDIYGVPMQEFEDNWAAWVLKTYRSEMQ